MKRWRGPALRRSQTRVLCWLSDNIGSQSGPTKDPSTEGLSGSNRSSALPDEPFGSSASRASVFGHACCSGSLSWLRTEDSRARNAHCCSCDRIASASEVPGSPAPTSPCEEGNRNEIPLLGHHSVERLDSSGLCIAVGLRRHDDKATSELSAVGRSFGNQPFHEPHCCSFSRR